MHNNHYFLYYFFDNPFIRWLRVIIFFGIGIVVYLNLDNPEFVLRLLPIYFVLILQEFFIHFKLENSHPVKTVHDKTNHIIESVDYKSRGYLERHRNLKDGIMQIAKDSSINYFNKLLNYKFELNDIQISEEELLKKAQDMSVAVNGLNIHGIDLYAAYLLLRDERDKSLFNKGINAHDLITILSWTRRQFRIDMKNNHGLHLTGNGAFDFFVYGWSAEIERYATNYTNEVLSKFQVEPIGRLREYDLLVTALSKNTTSNALLVGDAGVGKSTIVSKLVLDSNLGNLPKIISNKLVFKLFPERLLAGINNQGDFEQRIVNLFSELIHAGNIIVYIPNIENIFGGGGLNVDFSGVLIEYLKSNRIRIIGSTTEEAYKTFIYNKHEIKALFDVIEIDEADSETATFMILEKVIEIERNNHVVVTFGAVKEVMSLASSYINDGTAVPGSAIKLLDDVVAYCNIHGIKQITESEVDNFAEEKTQILLKSPTNTESQKLLNLESEIHKKVIAQDEAVSAVANAMRRVRSGMNDEEKPIASFLFLGPTGVGKTETAKALALSYFGSEDSMIRLDMSEYQASNSVERFIGSGGEQKTLADRVTNNPFSEILLDEFEKAHSSILDLFLQILDEGRLTDNLGRTVSFKNTIIIATSNAGSEFIREMYKNGEVTGANEMLLEKILKSGIFKPELLNRFDDVISFRPLKVEDVVKVSRIFLDKLVSKISEQQITLKYDQSCCEYIAKNAYSIEFGARNVNRFIEQSIENQLSKKILSGELGHGAEAYITVENEILVIKIQIPYTN